MPQWSRDRRLDAEKYPDERWAGVCSSSDVPLLVRYDHHVVRVDGRPALLLTYRLAELEPLARDARVSFEISFTYARGHPLAPAEAQAVVDRLTFRRVDASTRDASSAAAESVERSDTAPTDPSPAEAPPVDD